MAEARNGIGLLVGGLLASLWLGGGTSTGRPAVRLCLEVLDVGQGDALLLDLPGGERWLVDGGGDPSGRVDVGQRRLLPALRHRGVERIQRVFATHGDLDHVGGLSAVLQELEVDELWLPRRAGLGHGLRRLLSEAERRGVPVRSVEDGDALRAPAPLDATLLHPRPGWVEALGLDADENNGSIVLRLRLGDVAMLLTGDIEAPAEEHLLQQGLARTAVMKVPHHGSRSSSTAPLVEAADPRWLSPAPGARTGSAFPTPACPRGTCGGGRPCIGRAGTGSSASAPTDGAWRLSKRARRAGGPP